MAGMAIAIPGGLNISETGDTMGKIRWHRGNGQKTKKMSKKNLSSGQKNQVSPPLPSLPKWGNAAPGTWCPLTSPSHTPYYHIPPHSLGLEPAAAAAGSWAVPSYFTVRYFPLETLAPNIQGALQKVLVFINYFWGHKRSEQNKWWLFYGLCLVDPGPLQFAARGSHLITPWLCLKMLNWLLVGTICSRQHNATHVLGLVK